MIIKNVLASGISALMLLSVVFGVALNVSKVRGGGIIYIRADGSVEGTDKIQRVGNVYTFTDNINDSIVVEKDNIIIDGAGYALQGTWGIGLNLAYRSNVTIKSIVIKNFDYGIYFFCSQNNIISGNTITNNGIGVWLYASSNNSISGNNIANNGIGLYLEDSSSNKFHHNNFINNTHQVYDYSWDHNLCPPSINVWDKGYPSGGNYWSDYAGVDLYSGPYQNETGSDEIGDTPYIIDNNNRDRYPLIPEFSINIIPPLALAMLTSIAIITREKKTKNRM
ncbi:MAG: NosD domain-containing protein [Candidatus Bathyarchaeia archaeon]|nr:right-handed parallel beta-helix repeat-containing protein [Candidatus Bathyarchaeota archaeon]